MAATPDDLYQSKLLDAVKYRREKEESKLKSSVDYAITRNPDVAAKDQANARQMDLPMDFVIKNSDEVDKAARRQQILKNLEGTPVLKRLMEDAEFAAVAHDDVDTLLKTEETIGGTGESLKNSLMSGVYNIAATPYRWAEGIGRIADYFERIDKSLPGTGLLGAVRGAQRQLYGPEGLFPQEDINVEGTYAENIIKGLKVGEKVYGPHQAAERLERTAQILYPEVEKANQIGDAAFDELLSGNPEPFYENVLKDPRVLASFIGQAIPSLAVMMATGGRLEAIAMLEWSEVVSDAAQFEEMTGQKVEPEKFMTASIQATTLNTIAEKFSLKKIFGARGLFGALGAALAEMSTEMFQAFNTNLSVWLTYNEDKDLTAGVLPGGIGGFGAGFGGGVVSSMARKDSPRAKLETGAVKAQNALNAAEALDALAEVVSESTTRERSPSVFRAYLEDQLGIENSVYMDPEDAEAFFQSHPEVLEALPNDTRESIQEALEVGLSVSIPKADYLTSFTDFHEELKDNLRNDIDGYTRAEALEWGDTASEAFDTDFEQTISDVDLESEIAESAARVQTDIEAKLTQIGEAPEIARKQAALQMEFYTATAKRTGMTPEELYKRFPVNFQRQALQGVEGLTQQEQTEYQQAPLSKFLELGDMQRGKPEIAMTRVQSALGGGVLSPVVEHTGDLTHRMTHMLKRGVNDVWNSGYEYVSDKVDKVLRILEDPYGFEKEFEENIKNNAAYYKKTEDQFREELYNALEKYANEHRVLPVYNRAQRLARDAAIAIGMRDWRKAANNLRILKDHLGSPEEWHAFATEGLSTNILNQGPVPDAVAQYRAEEEARPIKDLIQTPIQNKDGTYRRNAKGDITGAPEDVKTDAQVQNIVDQNLDHMESPLAQMPSSAEWYEVSAQAIRDITHGNPVMMERMVRMMAVLSATNQVGGNTTGAIKAIHQLARGEVAAAGRFPNKFREISTDIINARDMDLSVPGVDSKVMSFYRNLWDATFQSDKYENAATMDMWMARLYGYKTDTVGKAQYRFANMVTQQITEQYNEKHGTNLKPRQIQAALWVYARNRERYGENIGADIALEDRSAFDTYIDRAKQNITLEAVPSVDSGLFPEIHQATPDQKRAYTRQAIQLLLNEKGENELFNKLEIPLYQMQESEGTFEGAVSPNEILSIVSEKVKGKTDFTRADLAARALQYIYTQDGVPWFQLDPTATGATRGVAINLNAEPTVEMEEAFLEHLNLTITADFTRVGNDFFLLNFTDLPNKQFIDGVVNAAETYEGPGAELIEEIETDVKAKGNYLAQDWADEQKAVAEIESEFSDAGQQDLLPWLRDRREAVARLQADFRDQNLALYQGPIASIEDVDPRLVVSPVDPNASQEERAKQLHQLGQENAEFVKPILQAIDQKFKSKSLPFTENNFKKIENIILNANRPSVRAQKPWHHVQHIRDAFRFKTVVNDYTDVDQMVQMFLDAGVSIVKADNMVIDPKSWGFRILAMDLLMPNGQIVEWYLPLKEVEAYKNSGGHELFEKWRNKKLDQLSKDEEQEYLTDVMTSYEEYSAAFDAALERSGQSESAWAASLDKAVALASSVTNVQSLSMSPSVNGTLAQTPSTLTADKPSPPTATEPVVDSKTNIGFTSTESIPQSAEAFRYLQPKRGQIQFPPEGSLITLLENADLSTFLHESGHHFFEVYKTLALENDAIRADMNVLLDFIGVDSLETWNMMTLAQREAGHEKVAQAFERYLFEGKAPSLEMQSLFDTFKSWLLQVYKSLTSFNVPLTDDVRQVFDRMLAAEEMIRSKEVADNYQAMFRDQDEAGLTEKQWQEYQNLDEAQRRASVSALERRSLNDLKWVNNKIAALVRASERDIQDKRKAMKEDVTLELETSPVYRAINFVKTGEFTDLDGNPQKIAKHKLDRDDFKLLFPNYDLPRGWTEAGGIPIDEMLAQQFGYETGPEMVKAMLNAAPLREQIERTTDQRMLEAYGDLIDPVKMHQAAEEAVHSDAHTRMLHTELNALSKRTGVKNLLHKAAKALAERTIGEKKINRIKSWEYSRQEKRAARESERAHRKGDRESAAEHKRAQILANHFWRAARNAEQKVESTVKYLKKFEKPGTRKNLDPEYRDQIDAILENVGLKRISQKEVERRKSFAQWYKEHEAEGVEVPSDYIERLKTHYTEMTYEELMGLRDNVKNIEHLGRLKHKIIVNRQVRDYNETMDEAHAVALQQNPQKYDPTDRAPKRFRRARALFSKLRASLIKVEFLASQLDGDKDNGPWWNLLFRPLADAEDLELRMQAEVQERLGEILKSDSFKHLGRKIYINQKAGHYDWNQVFSMALNWGNEGNRQALVEGLKDQQVSEEDVQRILNENLTENDWNTVQQIWDLIDSYWPQIADLQSRLTGVIPEKVERSPVETPFGEISGGYYPLVYDTDLSYRAFTRDQKLTVQELLETNFLRPTTRKGHTIERVGSAGQAVKLDIGVVAQHINNVIHDLSFREAILQTDKVIQDRRTADAVERVAGKEAYRMLRPWLASVANAHRPIVDPWEVGAKYLRKNATIVNMGFKLTTAVVQPLGYTQSIDLLGEKWAMHGLAQFYGNPLKAKALTEEVLEKSTFMKNRMGTFDRDINDSIRRLKKESGPLTTVQQWAFKHIGFLDMSIAIPTWKAGYDKALAEGLSEKDAIALGDKAVRMSQSAGSAKDLARVQGGSEYLRLLTMFYSYFSSMYNMMRRRRNISGRDPASMAKVARNTMSFLYLVALPAVLSELIVGRGPDDEDDEDFYGWMAKEVLAYPLMSVVGIRDITNSVVRGYGYEITPIAQGIESMVKGGEGALNVAMGEAEEKDFKNMLMASGYMFGLPSRQLWTLIDNTKALVEGDELTPPELIMLREQRE